MRRILFIWAAILMSAPLFPQGITDSLFTIEAVEVTGQRTFLKEQAGFRQTVVDTTLLWEKASLSLSDLLSENTSVFIKSNGRGAMATASFRGTAPSHTQVSWNGISISSPMLGMVDFSLIPVYIIDDLTLKHGAASLSDRGGGIGGSINIENRPDWGEGSAVSYIQGVGSYGTFDEFLQLGLGNRMIKSVTRLYHNRSENDYTFINRGIGNLDPKTGVVENPLDTNENGSYSRYGMVQELYVRPQKNHLVSVIYWGQFGQRAIPWPTSYEGPQNANLNNQEQEDHRVVARWKYYSSAGKFMIRSGYSGTQMDYLQLRKVPGLGSIPDVYSVSHQNSFLNTLSYEHDLGPELSVEGRLEMDHQDVNTQDTVSRIGYHEQRNEVSFFGAVRKSFGEKLNLNLMWRQEWIDGERVPFIPFLGIDYRLLKGEELILKTSIARNYHQPTLNDLYWQPNGNPDLLPEMGFTLEAGIDYRKLFGGQRLRTGLTWYRSHIENWIMWIPSSRMNLEPINIREVLSTGLEYDLGLRGEIRKFRYGITATYAYTRSVNLGDPLVWGDESYGKQLVYIPLHSGNLMVNLGFRNYFLTYQYNAYSERYTTSSNDLSRRDWLYPYFMNDVAVGGEFRIRNIRFSAELKVYNLFNETYHSVLYRPMPGRNFLVVIKIKI
jgi:iron complex outermembrane receptor protein